MTKLRKIDQYDSYLLVKWRNENAQYFPHRLNPLTLTEHDNWYNNTYQRDPSDHMYMVCIGAASVGTIGINIKNWEIQRVMRGEAGVAPGIMGEALDEMKDVYQGLRHFKLEVLETNPHAIAFYKRHGFYRTRSANARGMIQMEST